MKTVIERAIAHVGDDEMEEIKTKGGHIRIVRLVEHTRDRDGVYAERVVFISQVYVPDVPVLVYP